MAHRGFVHKQSLWHLSWAAKSPWEKAPYCIFVAYCAGDFARYFALCNAYPRKGHEIRDLPAKWAKLEPGSLEPIVTETGAFLKELFA